MSHLSPSEFVDLADGTLPAERAAHVDRCDGCRAQADAVRDALRLADAPVPEPSPLFWDHFSARVREAVAAAPQRSGFGFGLPALQPIAAVLVTGVMVFSAVWLARSTRPDRSAPAAVTARVPAGDADTTPAPTLDPDHAAEWAVLAAAVSDLPLDDARDAGMAVPATAVDQAVTQLTRDELSELGRLLQDELKRSGD